jgi:hypothetical protein
MLEGVLHCGEVTWSDDLLLKLPDRDTGGLVATPAQAADLSGMRCCEKSSGFTPSKL